MAVDAEDLIVQPFKELVERGKEAVRNAQDAQDDEADLGIVNQMLKSASSVVKEGERALQRLQPLWTSQVEKHGQAFLDAINDSEVISESRVALDDLLYDFDDFIEVETFDAERFSDIQSAAKSFGRTVIETIKRLRIEKSDATARPATPADSRPEQPLFPPLPPLPPLPQKSSISRPPTSHTVREADEFAVHPLRSTQHSLKRGPSSRSEISAKNAVRRSVASDASSFEIRSARRLNLQQIVQPDTEAVTHASRRPSSPEVLGAEFANVHLSNGTSSPINGNGEIQPLQLLGTAPRTTAWVHEQATSTRPRSVRDSIPEEMPMPSNASSRYTVRSSDRDSLIFDAPTSPTTARTSVFSTNESFYKHMPSLPPLPDSALRLNLHPPARLETPMETPRTPREPEIRSPTAEQTFDSGLILADEAPGGNRVAANDDSAQPIWYSRKVNCEIGPRSSLFSMGGFCKGAHLFAEGGMEAGTKSSYDYMSKTYEACCVDCQYSQDMSKLLADAKKDKKANFLTHGVRYRLRYLYKSHVFTNTPGVKNYGCLFCSQDGHTTREGDATVFGSLDSLFAHLARHPQPLQPVAGIKVLYGTEENLTDEDLQEYDLYFPNSPLPSNIPDDETVRLARLPVARATKSHDIGEEEVELVGPGGKKERPLPFLAGGRIIGLEFLEKWESKYCIGWHDGVRGYFPSKIVELEAPARGEVRLPGMNGDGVTVKARWKWAPKDSTMGWLNFKAGDTISNVSWTFQDQWCWSGMTKNGKVGFFPQSHIKPESIREALSNNSSAASIKSGNTTKTKKTTRLFSIKR
ncbi:uncharacterized protein JN550_003878 [Neoarthrinium moseri]|uniref:uncharacterized protein n=1 Tax=Neoarthrinium moseri TaxID=1658444 RepID=UPI001FDB1695|nr:uncharacterized protein JN550_003878 [Neoarthrinium moseri]KAI1872159.1 hypothetical protein JN550_003878 [Neoarthrinium moseri]